MRSRYVTFALIVVLTWGVEARPRRRTGHAARVATPPPVSFDAGTVNNSQITDMLAEGDRGSAVLRAQILLDRAHFSCGEIDGNFGTNMEKTVAAFQGDRNLPVTGNMDAQTWAALNADQAPALIPYTISADDEKGPFADIPKDLLQQAKLPALGYTSPLEELAERFHVSPSVLKALNPGTDFTREGQPMYAPNVLVLPPGDAARVEVSKSQSSVRAYDETGKLLAYYAATIGSTHDPLPIGDWKILGVSRYPVFHYNAKLFWDASDKNAKAVIRSGPNNPVGVVWIDLSKQHYGIHGTPEPSLIGHTTSHGCIRLTNWDAWELAAMVKPGLHANLKE